MSQAEKVYNKNSTEQVSFWLIYWLANFYLGTTFGAFQSIDSVDTYLI